MSELRVLQVIDEISLNSGVSSMLMNYYEHMDCKTIVFDFIVFDKIPKEVKASIEKKGSRLFELPSLSFRNICTGKIYKELLRVMKNHEYKIIHGHVPNAAFLYLRAAKKVGIPNRIIHSHNAKGTDYKMRKIRNFFLHKYGLIYANRYFACSKKAGDYLYGNIKKQVIIVNNAIDVEKFRYNEQERNRLKKELNWEDSFIIGHIGRFCLQKNHDFLIDIFEDLLKKMPDARLVLFGKGPDEDKILNKVKALGIEKSICFLGLTDRINEYMQAMDILLLPSLYEGLPVVCVEAQAAGLSCVVSDQVTQEVKITDDLRFLPIGQGTDEWVDLISKIRKENLNCSDREKAAHWLEAAGFSIIEESRKLEAYYLQLVGQENKNE